MKKRLNISWNRTVCTFIFSDSELSKLKIKLQNNNELIAAKDQQI